jgi:hypothetical protein
MEIAVGTAGEQPSAHADERHRADRALMQADENVGAVLEDAQFDDAVRSADGEPPGADRDADSVAEGRPYGDGRAGVQIGRDGPPGEFAVAAHRNQLLGMEGQPGHGTGMLHAGGEARAADVGGRDHRRLADGGADREPGVVEPNHRPQAVGLRRGHVLQRDAGVGVPHDQTAGVIDRGQPPAVRGERDAVDGLGMRAQHADRRRPGGGRGGFGRGEFEGVQPAGDVGGNPAPPVRRQGDRGERTVRRGDHGRPPVRRRVENQRTGPDADHRRPSGRRHRFALGVLHQQERPVVTEGRHPPIPGDQGDRAHRVGDPPSRGPGRAGGDVPDADVLVMAAGERPAVGRQGEHRHAGHGDRQPPQRPARGQFEQPGVGLVTSDRQTPVIGRHRRGRELAGVHPDRTGLGAVGGAEEADRPVGRDGGHRRSVAREGGGEHRHAGRVAVQRLPEPAVGGEKAGRTVVGPRHRQFAVGGEGHPRRGGVGGDRGGGRH